MLWSFITNMQHYYIMLTALTRGNIILTKILNTEALIYLYHPNINARLGTASHVQGFQCQA
jgi:hypothetical protein